MKTHVLMVAASIMACSAVAQTEIKVRSTNGIEVDYKPTLVEPITISWSMPAAEEVIEQTSTTGIKFAVESRSAIKSVIVSVSIEGNPNAPVVRSQPVVPGPEEKLRMVIDKSVRLMEGVNIIEVTAENESGGTMKSSRRVLNGTSVIAQKISSSRKDYALLFATDEYESFDPLVNPAFDARTIKEELEKNYGFAVELILNATDQEILVKIREYAERKFEAPDQLFIFFAGHGYFDETFKEGYVVCRNSLPLDKDKARTSYLSHERLRNIINSIPCEHIFLVMDVCFGGTFDRLMASRGMDEEYSGITRAEFIVRKLQHKTRRYITSGGKTYVSDGVKGRHSPFARRILEALRTYGGKDGIVTTDELRVHLADLKNEPHYGEFGDNVPGSDFIFVAVR